MSTNPLRRGCSPAQTFPFSTSAAGLHGPPPRRRAGAPRSSSANLMNGNITDEPFRSQEPAFLSKTPGISYKETNGIGQHAPYLFHAGNAIPPCRRNPERTMEKQPENVLKKRTSAARNRYDTRESTTCRDGHTPERTGTDGRTTTHTRRGFRR